MPTEVLTALISAGAAVLTAVVALLLNHRAFTMLDNHISDSNRRIDDTNRRFDARLEDTNRRFEDMNKRIDDTNRRIDDFKAEMVRRLERIKTDLKEFFKVLAEHDKRFQRLEDKP
jgi:predicted  nucleic acid-binding Zn-ribbon protein